MWSFLDVVDKNNDSKGGGVNWLESFLRVMGGHVYDGSYLQ